MASRKGVEKAPSLRCLGVPELVVDLKAQTLTQQHSRLLSVLVAAGPSGLEADGILESLWGADLPKAGTQAVYSLVGRLPSKSTMLDNEGGRYRLDASVEVDAWRFDTLVDDGELASQLEGIQLWRGRPFDGVEAGDIVADEASRLLRKRIAATESVARNASREQLRSAEEQILGATNDDPYNEPLVIAAASALYRLNKRRDALSVLQSCRAKLRTDLGLGGSTELDAAELALLNDENPIAPVRERIAVAETSVDPLPLILAPRSSLFVGREDDMDRLDKTLSAASERTGRGRVVLIHGEAGIGKSELVAQFATEADDLNVRVGTNATGSSAAYASWLQAIPEASSALVQLSAASDPSAANLVFWRDVEHTIQSLARDIPLVIVLEDIHQADAQSQLLFSWLASGSLPAGVLLLATTRPAEDGSAWAGSINELRGRQDTEVATVIDVEPLSLASIQQMVAARFPDHNPARTFRFASQVHALSQGNPLVSSALIKDAEEPTDLVTSSDLTIEEHHAQSVRGRVDGVVSGVLTNAALIGYEFTLEDVARLSEMTSSSALVHIETAMAAGLVVEAEELGRFRFDHILTTEAFAQRASRVRRAQTFRSLIEFDGLPAADRVRYIRGAFSGRKPEEAAQAGELLWFEAKALAEALSFSESRSSAEYAVEMFDSAGQVPDLELLILRAEVTARSGDLNQMERYRQEAFDAAQERGTTDDMARAALVGLPATERHEGDLPLLELLEQIDPEQIEDRLVRAAFLSQYLRAARIVGDNDEALARTQKFGREEFGNAELWANFRLEQLQIHYGLKRDPTIVEELDQLANDLDPSVARTRLRFSALLFAVIEQEADAITRRVDEARAELLIHPLPRLQWAFELLQSGLALVGVIEHSSSNAESALDTGFRLGVADAFTSFGAQSWHALWLEGRFDDALALLEGAKGMIESNVGWRCAEAFSLAACGRSVEARQLAEDAGDELRSSPSTLWSQAGAALLIEACSLLDDSQHLAKVAVDVLMPRSGSALLLGIGVAYLGPVDAYIGRALAITGADEASDFARRGEEQAQRAGFLQHSAPKDADEEDLAQ